MVSTSNLDLSSQFVALWRVHVAVVVTQVAGGAVFWSLETLHRVLPNLWVGAAAGSFPGLLIGLALQRAYSDQWHRSALALRRLYIICAVLMTFVGAPLALLVLTALEGGA